MPEVEGDAPQVVVAQRVAQHDVGHRLGRTAIHVGRGAVGREDAPARVHQALQVGQQGRYVLGLVDDGALPEAAQKAAADAAAASDAAEEQAAIAKAAVDALKTVGVEGEVSVPVGPFALRSRGAETMRIYGVLAQPFALAGDVPVLGKIKSGTALLFDPREQAATEIGIRRGVQQEALLGPPQHLDPCDDACRRHFVCRRSRRFFC